jgi:hypothetical protein
MINDKVLRYAKVKVSKNGERKWVVKFMN